jgi:ribose/xylose/arabinose/galactoside ABC-type transport system permease subunit
MNPALNRVAPFARWEVALALVLVADLVLNTILSPYFLDVWVWSDAMFYVTERAVVALPLALLIIAGEIDISIAGIIALSSVAMGVGAAQGIPTPGLLAIGLLTGLCAGAINGALVTVFRVSSIVATIGTMTLFRGAAYAVLGGCSRITRLPLRHSAAATHSAQCRSSCASSSHSQHWRRSFCTTPGGDAASSRWAPMRRPRGGLECRSIAIGFSCSARLD